jgi:hypothetical protein
MQIAGRLRKAMSRFWEGMKNFTSFVTTRTVLTRSTEGESFCLSRFDPDFDIMTIVSRPDDYSASGMVENHRKKLKGTIRDFIVSCRIVGFAIKCALLIAPAGTGNLFMAVKLAVTLIKGMKELLDEIETELPTWAEA